MKISIKRIDVVCILKPVTVLVGALILISCANYDIKNNKRNHSKQVVENIIPTPPLLQTEHFGEAISLIHVEDVFELSEQQKEHFFEFYNHPYYQNEEPHNRIYRYLETKLGGFTYNGQTSTASKSLAEDQGNCLSLAILTKSLANLANIDIDYQLVETPAVYQKKNDIVVSSQHIRTVVYAPFDNGNFFRGRIYIDYFYQPGTRVLREVKDKEFQSMYYTNKAAESLMEDNMRLAYWYLSAALKLKSNHSHAINMMGLLYAREGFLDAAEKMYLYGIDYSELNLDILNNYHSLLISQDRIAAAKMIEKKIGKSNDINPYKWISLANSAYSIGEIDKAMRYYKKAVLLAPYLHEPFAGIARAEFKKGSANRATKAIEQAIKNVFDSNTMKLYQAKLDMLKEFVNEKSPVVSGGQ